MVSRMAEIVGAVAIVSLGFTAVGALTQGADKASPLERGQILHSSYAAIGPAFDDGYTAKLALAQFPLPVAANNQGDLGQRLVLALQQELSGRGYDVGQTDGTLSPETRAAIRKYEAQSGLDVTGEATQNLLAHIRVTRSFGDAAAPDGQIEKRELVMRVQRRLSELGYAPGPADGALTQATREAIAAFEADRGLPQTGDLSPLLVQGLGTGNASIEF